MDFREYIGNESRSHVKLFTREMVRSDAGHRMAWEARGGPWRPMLTGYVTGTEVDVERGRLSHWSCSI